MYLDYYYYVMSITIKWSVDKRELVNFHDLDSERSKGPSDLTTMFIFLLATQKKNIQ